MPLFPESVNAFGVIAFVAFLACWIGGVLSAWAMHRAGDAKHFRDGLGVWDQPEPRKRFLRFLGFAFLGVLCVGAALAFGGWPTGYE